MISPLMGWGLLLLFMLIYFTPAITAFESKKKNSIAIFTLNLLLGWTLIGWVLALVWALIKD
jgi:hypothetical protein